MSGAAMGTVFGVTGFVDFKKVAPFINHMFRQVGTRVLGNATHTWDADLLKKIAAGKFNEIDSQQIFDELLFTYFSRHKVNKAQFFKDVERVNTEAERLGLKPVENLKTPEMIAREKEIIRMKKIGEKIAKGEKPTIEEMWEEEPVDAEMRAKGKKEMANWALKELQEPTEEPVKPVEPRTKIIPTKGKGIPGQRALELKKELGKKGIVEKHAGLNLRAGIDAFNKHMEKTYGTTENSISKAEADTITKEAKKVHKSKGVIWGLKVETNLRRFGKEGNKLADKGIKYIKDRNQGEQTDLFLLHGARRVMEEGMKLSPKDKALHRTGLSMKVNNAIAERWWDLRTGKSKPKNEYEKASLEILDTLFDKISSRSKASEVEVITPTGKTKPFKELTNYMPREYKNLEAFLLSSKRGFERLREIYTEEIAKKLNPELYKLKKEEALKKAKRVFNGLKDDLTTRPMGHLERQRLLSEEALQKMEERWKKEYPGKEFPLKLEKSYDVLTRYFVEANERLAWIEQFGKDVEMKRGYVPEEIKNVLETMSNQRGREFIKNFFRDYLNAGSLISSKAMNWSRNFRLLETAKLALAFIPNSLQWFTNTMPLMSVRDMPGVLSGLAGKKAKVLAREKFAKTGAATFKQDFNLAVLADPMKANRLTSAMLKLHGFSGTEFFNAAFAAHAGKRKAVRLSRSLYKGKGKSWRSPYYMEELKKLGLNQKDVETIIKDGPFTEKNVKELSDAAFHFRRMTQFSADAFSLPKTWSTPVGKLLTQFKNFAYNQTALLWNEPIKEAGRFVKSGGQRGDITKLMKMLPALTFAGALVTKIKERLYSRLGVHFYEEILTGNDTLSKAFLMACNAGGFGIATDLAMAIPYGKTGLIGIVGGPTVSDIASFTEAAAKTIGEINTAIAHKNLKWLPRRAKTIETYWLKFGEGVSPDIRTIIQAHFKKYRQLKTVNNWNTLYREARVKYRLIWADKGNAKAEQFWNAYLQTHGKEYEEVFGHPPNKPTEAQVNNWLEDQGKHPVERIPGVGAGKKTKKKPKKVTTAYWY